MKLILDRTECDAYGTFGILTGKGQQYLRTCEAPWKCHDSEGKTHYPYGAPFESCVPRGTYQLIMKDSAKYGPSWHLIGDGVTFKKRNDSKRFACLFHSANHPDQLMGCIAPGMTIGYPVGRYGVGNSKPAMDHLESWLTFDENHTLLIR